MQTLSYPSFSVVPIRHLLRNWKEITKRVNKEKKPAVVFSHNEPQVAIVPIEMFNRLEKDFKALEKFVNEAPDTEEEITKK